MRLGRYLGAIGLSLLLAMPVVAQTPSPSKSPATAPNATAKATQPAGQLVDINSASAEELGNRHAGSLRHQVAGGDIQPASDRRGSVFANIEPLDRFRYFINFNS